MILEFTLENYRSFRDRATWSMEPEARIKERDPDVNDRNTTRAGDVDLLKVAGIYGANASGKSNIVRGLFTLRSLVLHSSKETQAGEGFPIEPFKLDATTAHAPTTLEVVALAHELQFRYRVELTVEKVVREELWLRPAGADEETLAFDRTGQSYACGPAWSRDSEVERRTRENALHLSVASQFNNPIAEQIVEWFRDVRVINALAHLDNRRTAQLLRDPATADLVRTLIRHADFGIVDIEVQTYDAEQLPRDLPANVRDMIARTSPRLVFTHESTRQDGSLDRVTFDESEESAGTLKLTKLAGAIVNALMQGTPLIVDEIDARLHTLLTLQVVRLFQDEVSNPRHAQLLFATHDSNLLTRTLLRRDQIWFTEKNRATGATELYSLAEIQTDDGKVIRNDRNYEADYLQGRYGAVPFFGNLRSLVGDLLSRGDR